jgi:hypothetical protein
LKVNSSRRIHETYGILHAAPASGGSDYTCLRQEILIPHAL